MPLQKSLSHQYLSPSSTFTETVNIPYSSHPDVIGPVQVSCPTCDTDLGPQVRVALESTWSTNQRPAYQEAYLTCPPCQKTWVAALQLARAAMTAKVVAA